MLKNKLVLSSMIFLMILINFSQNIPYGLNDVLVSSNKLIYLPQAISLPFVVEGKTIIMPEIPYSNTLSSCFSQTQNAFINPYVAPNDQILGLRISYEFICEPSANTLDWTLEQAETFDVLITTSPMGGYPEFPLYNSIVLRSFSGLTQYQLLLKYENPEFTINSTTYPLTRQYMVVFKVDKLNVFFMTPRFIREITDEDLRELTKTLDQYTSELLKLTQ